MLRSTRIGRQERKEQHTSETPAPSPAGEAELAPILSQAQAIAARLEGRVGSRELALAVLAREPRRLVRVARRNGLEPKHLLWALGEWWTEGPPSTAAPPLTPEARALLSRAAGATPQDAVEALCDQMLRPDAACTAAKPCDESGAEHANGATVAVLRSLSLI